MKAYTRQTEDLQSLYSLMTVLIVTPYYACVCWHCWKSCRTEAKTNMCAQFRAALCRRCGWAWKGKAYLLGPTRTLVLPEKVVSSGINQSSFRGCCEVWLGWWRTIAREQNLSCPQPVLQQALSVKVRWRLVSVVVTVLFCLKKTTKDPEGIWPLPRSPMPLKKHEGTWAHFRSRVLPVSSPVSLFLSLCRYPSTCPQIWCHMQLQWLVWLTGCLAGRQKVHLPPEYNKSISICHPLTAFLGDKKKSYSAD